jgi:hypothetical protein
MKRLTRGEVLLLGAPVAAFALFAAGFVAWKKTRPATLDPAPFPLYVARASRDGRWVIGIAQQRDGQNRPLSGTSLLLLRWNARDGHLVSNFSEARRFGSWNFSRDGELIAFVVSGNYNRRTLKRNTTVVVRSLEGGEQLALWPVTSDLYGRKMMFSPDKRELILLGPNIECRDIASTQVRLQLDAARLFGHPTSVDNARFSPNGRRLALLEEASGSGSNKLPPHAAATSTGQSGGRIVVVSWPQGKVLARPQGNLFADLDWTPEGNLVAAAPLRGGSQLLKMLRADINLKTGQTRWKQLPWPAAPPGGFNRIFVNGAKGWVLADTTGSLLLWKRDGTLASEMNFDKEPLGGPLCVQISHDGRFLLHVVGKDIERYDLSRY